MNKRSGSVYNFNVIAQFFKNRWPIKRNTFLTQVSFFKGISKAICNLVLYKFMEGTKRSFTLNGKVPFQEQQQRPF